MKEHNGEAARRKFRARFGVPKEAEAALDSIVSPLEQGRIAEFEKETFGAEDLRRAGLAAEDLYRRGLVNYTDESARSFRFNNFYTLLDVFVIAEPEKYRALAKETQAALDAWYFSAYYAGLNRNPQERPSKDAVLTLAEALRRVETEERQAYLAHCDCRVLAGAHNGCGKPLLTCVSYRSGINTVAHRGVSTPITKERAAQVIRDADDAGLIHTANANTICNCCTDCCYLSRARKRRNAEQSAGGPLFLSWPKVSRRVQADWEKCVSCGLCEERCPFHLFSAADRRIDAGRCVGCSLCVNTCPAGALSLTPVPQPE
ncbi:MAG: 4Fe-4S binding protein [Spirochaetaceae bacterium]|jgi:formate hydrogenlyase subunit 6/NADH:ubiquinone oxidoreductase subunit I|nr:4Fe-4S binding protein [Spirochaetaceae bacterium]